MDIAQKPIRVAKFWINAGKYFCYFYENNSSQDFFCIAKILVLMVCLLYRDSAETSCINSRPKKGEPPYLQSLLTGHRRAHR